MTRERRAFGTWHSPISPRMLAGGMRFLDVQVDNDGESVVWLESRAGQTALLTQHGDDALRELTESDMNIRGKIAYGGGEFTVAGGIVYFVGNNGRLYRQALSGGRARPITPAYGSAASPTVSPDGKWVVYVHQYEDTDLFLIVDSMGKHLPRKLFVGTDFVMQPAWSADGSRLACVTWNFPHMPWDNTELRLFTLTRAEGDFPRISESAIVAGGDDISIFQPTFSPDGSKLAYVSDQEGWWQLYVYDIDTAEHHRLTSDEAEYGTPAWLQGIRMYAWSPDGSALYALRNHHASTALRRISVTTGENTLIDALGEYTALAAISVAGETLALVSASTVQPERVISLDTRTNRVRVHRRASTENIPQSSLSRGQAVSWQGEDGETVHGLYYPPASERYEGIGLPPLIVIIHGGPTSQARMVYAAEAQFYATRGFAVLFVNHRGSTGYGKAYKDKHRLSWGITDVQDAASGARYLAQEGLVDDRKRVIYGGSAGGYTVLQSLVDMPGFWMAGVCLYGISNQFTLVSEADFKFESRYSETLLGSLPESAARYRDRSPLFHAERIVDPVILFQGDEDNVVPKSQSDSIVEILKQRAVPHEYHVYAGEGHGWRKPETIEAYLKATLKFLERYVVYA
jgi:dipeptidyl aminopeptidase/acylaminoacyl peptidase